MAKLSCRLEPCDARSRSSWRPAGESATPPAADVIVTGHSEPVRDKALRQVTLDVFRVLLKEGKAARAQGLDADQAKDRLMPALQPLMVKLTGDVPARNTAFRTQLVDWFLHRVYDEVAGPLTDAIAPIPPR